MIVAGLIFSGWNWLWFAIAVALLGLSLLIWGYRQPSIGSLRWLCLSLKFLGLAALLFCLLEPLWSGQRARPGANLFAIIADNSQGLQVKDRGSLTSRGEQLRGILDPLKQRWQDDLEENFELRRYLFDARLQSSKDFSDLAFDGKASAIGSALRTVAERYRGRPLAGILLMTDGNATDLREVPDLTGLPPIYPVVLGSADSVQDIAVDQVHVSQSAFEDAPVSIQTEVNATGFASENIVVQVLDASGKKMAEQALRARKDSDKLSFRFQFRPETPGLSFYRLKVRASSEVNSTDTDKTSEATLANNSRVLVVDRGRGPYRILYVAGRPNWEFKFLNRAVQDDAQLQMVGLIRVAKREPKFNFMGRPGESSNPLFRGFGNQAPEEVERYDQPVLVRLNTRDEIELRAGFPRTPEELYGYSAVIVDDLEAEFFTAEQSTLLQHFVSERGGGFLMLGGMETFREGNYQRTPIGDMLPVYLEHTEEAGPSRPLRMNLTHEGFLEAWARLRDNEAGEKQRLDSMAPFQVLNRVREAKPGASVIATVSDESGKSWPAIVVQKFGKGRTAALTIGDVWHWGLHDEDAHRDMDKSWRQLMRWLVTDVPQPVELTAEPLAEEGGGGVLLQVRARDPKFQPLDNAGVAVDIQPVFSEGPSVSTNTVRLRAEPSDKEPGLYEVKYVPRNTGGYHATAFVTNSVGAEVGRAEAGWSVDLAAEEFRSLNPNISLLEGISRKTGGEIISADKLAEFARNLPRKHAPVMEAWTFPVWHTPAVFAFALACFLGEWGLRRWKGMA